MNEVTPTLTLKEIRKGDQFASVPANNIAATGGTITKIGRINIEFSGLYMGRIAQDGIKLPKANLIGGAILRDGKLFNVTDRKPAP